MNQKERQTRIELWKENSFRGFMAWLEDFQVKVLMDTEYQIFKPTEHQIYLLKEILKPAEKPIITPDEPIKKLAKRSINARAPRPRKDKTPATEIHERASAYKNSQILLIQPRRHGKSTLLALLCIYFAVTRKNQTIQLLGNNEQHCKKVMYSTILKIVNHTKRLQKLIPLEDQFVYESFCRPMGSVIQLGMGNTLQNAFGDKITILWISDLHAAADDSIMAAMQSSLLDSKNSMCLIDSNVDHDGGNCHILQEAAKDDNNFFVDHVYYDNLEQYCREGGAPAWISRSRARRLEKTILEPDFKRDILGLRSSMVNSLFPIDVIDSCKEKYSIPVEDIQTLARGRSYQVGSGLDRSKSLLGAIGHGDNSIWTTVLKVANLNNEEPEIWLLNQKNIIPNTSAVIKKAILEDHKRYHIDEILLESYEVVDLLPWINQQNIKVATIAPHSTNQNLAFPHLANLARNGFLKIPVDAKKLISEMGTFVFSKARRGEGYSFSHSSRKFKDDRCFSLCWAVHSLRDKVMNLYNLSTINCKSRSKNRNLCFLMGGGLELFCAGNCDAAQEVDELFRQYLQTQLDSDILLPEFFHEYVRLTGARISQR